MKAAALFMALTAYVPQQNGALQQPCLDGLTMAVSQDKRHMLRQWWYVKGFGWRYAQDVMHRRWTNKLDVAVYCREEARTIGKQTVEVSR